MLFFAVKQASGHGSKERRRALAATSDPFSVQTRSGRQLSSTSNGRRGAGGRRERGKRSWERGREEAARGSVPFWSSRTYRQTDRQTAAFAFPIPHWERSPTSILPKKFSYSPNKQLPTVLLHCSRSPFRYLFPEIRSPSSPNWIGLRADSSLPRRAKTLHTFDQFPARPPRTLLGFLISSPCCK